MTIDFSIRGLMEQRAMQRAFMAACHSPDPSTQNGAILLTPEGDELHDCNRFPFGVQYFEERLVRPLKYRYIEHAERNVIYKAAQLGKPTAGSTLVAPWAACADCARAIVQVGIARLVRLPFEDDANERWMEDILIGDTIMREGGVEIADIEYDDERPTIRRNGVLV